MGTRREGVNLSTKTCKNALTGIRLETRNERKLIRNLNAIMEKQPIIKPVIWILFIKTSMQNGCCGPHRVLITPSGIYKTDSNYEWLKSRETQSNKSNEIDSAE